MKGKRTRLILSVVALLVAAAAADYHYTGWPDIPYLAADRQTRQKLETEKLERGYRTAAKAFEQQLRTTLPKDPDIAAKIESYNSAILNGRKKYVDLMEGFRKSANELATKYSQRSQPFSEPSKYDAKGALPDTMLIREIRVDSVSDKATSIRTDNEDLLKRYHADVNVTISVVRVEGKSFIIQNGFIANATPDRNWTFPSVAEVKQRVLNGLDELNRAVESETDSTVNKNKLNLELDIHKLELELEKRQFQEKYGRPF